MTTALAPRTRHFFVVIDVFADDHFLEGIDLPSALGFKGEEKASAQVRQHDDGCDKWQELRIELTLCRDETPADLDWAKVLQLHKSDFALAICEEA
jgi:hypothetical protein